MNHQALYRKYRPTNFSQVIGQENIITILKNSIINKSFVHAYLFSGTRGTGKTSVARILAKTINCDNQIDGEACNQCSNCKIINDNSNEIDILEIDGASNNGVEEIRTIRNNINLLPMNLKYKVYIIDEVHMLTTAAFNALLKTLEEPPKHIIFIFATTEPYKIPETIISRCQWLQFEKINHDDLVRVFAEIVAAEKIVFEPAALSELALLAAGSLRDGINNLEKVFNFAHSLTFANVKKVFNLVSFEKKINFLIAILNHDVKTIVLLLDEFIVDFKKILIDVLSLVQELIIYGLTKNITLCKSLSLVQINLFAPVVIEDLKLLLNLFENIIILNFDPQNLKTLLVTKILKGFDHFKKYHLNKQENNFSETKNQLPVDETKNEIKVAAESDIISQTMLDHVLNVIVQADKEIRKEVQAHWLKINQLVENNKFRNFSKIYLNTIISAACENALIIICDNIIQANFINKNFCFQEHRNFLNFVLTKKYMIYALDKNQWQMVKEKYQILAKNHQLPKPKVVLIPEAIAEKKLEIKSQTLNFLQNIFSEIEEI